MLLRIGEHDLDRARLVVELHRLGTNDETTIDPEEFGRVITPSFLDGIHDWAGQALFARIDLGPVVHERGSERLRQIAVGEQLETVLLTLVLRIFVGIRMWLESRGAQAQSQCLCLRSIIRASLT